MKFRGASRIHALLNAHREMLPPEQKTHHRGL